jgi:tryptophan synthase alpha chain
MSQRPGEKLAQAIRDVRKDRVALVAFLTAGYPRKATFREDLAAIAAEADVVEIGVPFSDPMADGVTIQRSSMAALHQGVTLHWIMEELAQMPRVKTPLVLMSYLNPLLAYGFDKLAEVSAQVGVTGFIVPDLPLEEAGEFEAALSRQGLALVRMVTPVTPPERLKKICSTAQGFVYAVTMTGVTGKAVGAGQVDAVAAAGEYLDRVRALSPVPVCAGFGIRQASQVQKLAPHTDGAIVGSAIVEALERGESAADLLKSLRGGA